eukprot:2634631-Rhodomonas_salina.2
MQSPFSPTLPITGPHLVLGRESAKSSPAHHTAGVEAGQRKQSVERTESSPAHHIAGAGAGAGARRTDSSISTQ